MPDGAISLLERAGVSGRVAQRRARHVGAQVGAERRQQLRLSGEEARGRDVVRRAFSDAAGKPAALSRLAPTRPAWRWPASVTTGTPIHSASHVVVVPL